MTLDAPLAVGFTAQIFAWQDGQVLKLFNQGISRSTVEYEANLTRIVHSTGYPSPAVGEILELDGRFGLELERVDGISMLDVITQRPWKYAMYAHQLAELQADMHRRHAPGLPSQVEKLQHKIRIAEKLTDQLRQAALDALEKLPQDDCMCHGDFHPNNIILTGHGPVIIDWMDASQGLPEMDVARSTLLFGGGQLPSTVPGARLINFLQRWFYQGYLKRYTRRTGMDPQRMQAYIPLAAAARLAENITFDEQRLLSIVQAWVGGG